MLQITCYRTRKVHTRCLFVELFRHDFPQCNLTFESVNLFCYNSSIYTKTAITVLTYTQQYLTIT